MPYRQVLLRHLLFARARDESTSSRRPYNTFHEFALIFLCIPNKWLWAQDVQKYKKKGRKKRRSKI